MALSTYDELVKTIVKYSHRSDIQDLIPDFILLAETEMFNNEGWQLETRDMETVQTVTTTDRYIDLPVGYEKSRSIQLVTGNGFCDVKYQAPEQLVRRVSTGRPRFFTVIGNQIEFDVTPDSVYDLQIQFYKKPDPITKDNQTNSVLTNHANIYLFGTLHQLFIWSQDTEQAVMFFSKSQSVIRGANKAAKKARYGAAPSMSVEGAVV